MVVDASAVIHAMLYDDDDARQIRRSLGGKQVVVPPHFHIECVSAIRGVIRGGNVSEGVGAGMVAEIAQIPFQVVPFSVIADAALDSIDNISSYDNAYVSVARMYNAPLVTRDARLRKAVEKLIRTIP